MNKVDNFRNQKNKLNESGRWILIKIKIYVDLLENEGGVEKINEIKSQYLERLIN